MKNRGGEGTTYGDRKRKMANEEGESKGKESQETEAEEGTEDGKLVPSRSGGRWGHSPARASGGCEREGWVRSSHK